MTTAWTNPTLITQYAEPGGEDMHLLWDDSNNFNELRNLDGHTVGTLKPLIHIARSPKLDVVNKTYYIRLTGYNFVNLPSVVSGIELRLTANRGGRITDDTVQLCLNDDFFGDNNATLSLDPMKIYGGDTKLWGLKTIQVSDVQNPSFGITLRFRSHPSWPHKTPIDIDAVEMRIH